MLALLREARTTGETDAALDAILLYGYPHHRARIACGLRPICSGCHEEIDPKNCWCGIDLQSHNDWDEGHPGIPRGCECLRASAQESFP